MSINACQISGFTINAICAARRRALIDSLLPEIQDGGRASVQKINPFTRQLIDDEVDVSLLEMPQVKVSILLNGVEYFEVLDRADATFVPAISIAALKVNPEISENVSIFNIQSRSINDVVTLNITNIMVRSAENE